MSDKERKSRERKGRLIMAIGMGLFMVGGPIGFLIGLGLLIYSVVLDIHNLWILIGAILIFFFSFVTAFFTLLA